MVIVTKHAQKRTKTRAGLPRRVSDKNAERALLYGIKHSDTSGSLNRYMTALYMKQGTANNIRIYNGKVYIFHDETLITILDLPPKYRKIAERIKKGGE